MQVGVPCEQSNNELSLEVELIWNRSGTDLEMSSLRTSYHH